MNILFFVIGFINTILWFLSTLGSKITIVSYDVTCQITEFFNNYFGWYFQYGIAQVISIIIIFFIIFNLFKKKVSIPKIIAIFIFNFLWIIDYIFLRIG